MAKFRRNWYKGKEEDVDDELSDSGSNIVKYEWILNSHINLCRQALIRRPNRDNIEEMRLAVDCFEDMMVAFLDDNYNNEINKEKKKYQEAIEKVKREKGKEYYAQVAPTMEFNFIKKKWRALILLSTRRGFTVVQEMTDYIGVSKDAKL